MVNYVKQLTKIECHKGLFKILRFFFKSYLSANQHFNLGLGTKKHEIFSNP